MTKEKNIKEENKMEDQKQEQPEQLNGFNLDDLRAKPEEPSIFIKKKQTTIPADAPNSQQWYKIHPTKEELLYLIHFKEDGAFYLVHPKMEPYLASYWQRYKVYLGMHFPSGNLFLYPVMQPDKNGNQNSWHKSKEKIINNEAKQSWIQQVPERDISGYSVRVPTGALNDIPFPEEIDMQELIFKAFKDRYIDNENHPVVKSLLGA